MRLAIQFSVNFLLIHMENGCERVFVRIVWQSLYGNFKADAHFYYYYYLLFHFIAINDTHLVGSSCVYKIIFAKFGLSYFFEFSSAQHKWAMHTELKITNKNTIFPRKNGKF